MSVEGGAKIHRKIPRFCIWLLILVHLPSSSTTSSTPCIGQSRLMLNCSWKPGESSRGQYVL